MLQKCTFNCEDVVSLSTFTTSMLDADSIGFKFLVKQKYFLCKLIEKGGEGSEEKKGGKGGKRNTWSQSPLPEGLEPELVAIVTRKSKYVSIFLEQLTINYHLNNAWRRGKGEPETYNATKHKAHLLRSYSPTLHHPRLVLAFMEVILEIYKKAKGDLKTMIREYVPVWEAFQELCVQQVLKEGH